MKDFRLKDYMRLVFALQKAGIPLYTVAEWIRARPVRGAVMRHDVDRRPWNAVRMAEAEREAGISSTYYFRVVGSANNPEAMKKVAALGHEVGYHYEDLTLARGNVREALELFGAHLEALRKVVPISTVVMHGSPLSPHNNLDMWQQGNLADFKLQGDAFLSIDYSGTLYFTDTGRRWNSSTTNLRDRPPLAITGELNGSGTNALVDFIGDNDLTKMAFSVHPERWDATAGGWASQYARDLIFNAAKRLIALTR